jgi:precorrin-4/cobalt-precorrin-4 C11-methyltransferase
MRQTGIFYGIGVGPGDPELMTLKAVRTIRDCDVIVLPVSNRELTEPLLLEQNEMENRAAGYLESCTAYQIAVQTVSELKEKQILFLPMPMIKDKEKLRKIHARGAEVIEQFLEKGWNLAFLTLGDPTVYSTCMYIEQMIEQDGYQVETVSGIPSFCAAAARLNQPLGEQEEQIHILPGSYEAGEGLQLSGTKILMKTGKKTDKRVFTGEQSGYLSCRKLWNGRRTYCPISGRDFRRCGILFPSNCKRQEKIEKAGRIMITFVGAGPGAEDLITVRGQRLLKEADIVIYAGSLVNPGLLKLCKEKCEIYNSAKMTLEEVLEVMVKGYGDGKEIVRLHTGDPCLYGAIREQMDELKKLEIPYEDCPGVSSFCGAAAALEAEYTLPGISQSVVITRMAGRTPVPEKESVRSFAAHQATMVLFLSTGLLKELSAELIEGGYNEDTPAAIVYKATWPEQKVLRCTVGTLEQTAREADVTKTALIVVGEVLDGTYERSKLYDPTFTTEFRQASCSKKDSGQTGEDQSTEMRQEAEEQNK